MTDLIADGLEWLAAQQKEFCSKTVTYSRGEDEVSVAAMIGSTPFELRTDDGIAEEFTSRDYSILAADLILDGETIEPRAGDRITEVVGSVTYIYELMAAGGVPPASLDPTRTQWLVHTKLVEKT